MLKKYKILTLTHHNISLKELGRYVIPTTEGDLLQQKLHEMKQALRVDELMYLATCNRVMYFFTNEQLLDAPFITRLFKMTNPSLTEQEIETGIDAAKLYQGEAAMEHLFEVASSMDSLVIGERQILGQLRAAYDQSKAWELTGDDIRLALRYAVETAKSVYDKTRIGERPVSVVSLAIQEMRKQNLPTNSRILLVGAGQTNTLAAKFLVKYGFDNVHVFNRSQDKAQGLANRFEGTGFALDAMPTYKAGFDVLIVCTGSTEAIIDTAIYESLLNGETDKKIIIDLSMPNNVATPVTENFDNHYIEVEGLRKLANDNHNFRKNEVLKAQVLLAEQISTFRVVYQQRQLEKVLQHVPAQIKAIKSHAMDVVFKKDLDEMDDDTRDLFERMITYMEKRCISVPMKAAKEIV